MIQKGFRTAIKLIIICVLLVIFSARTLSSPALVLGQITEGGGEAPWQVVDAVREALAERPGRRLDAGRLAALGVPGRPAPPLAEAGEVLQRDVVAGHVKKRVEKRRRVSGRENEPVAVRPRWVPGMVNEKPIPEDIRRS